MARMTKVLAACLLLVSAHAEASLDPRSLSSRSAGTDPKEESDAVKMESLQSVVEEADDCYVRHIKGSRREKDFDNGELNKLIVEFTPACIDELRNIVATHDLLYGAGSGEAFFYGPFLDNLSSAIAKKLH